MRFRASHIASFFTWLDESIFSKNSQSSACLTLIASGWRTNKDPSPVPPRPFTIGTMFFSLHPSDALTKTTAFIEPNISNPKTGDKFQFQRMGYFCVDQDSNENKIVFNKTVGLRDNWAKQKTKSTPKAVQPIKPKQKRKAIDLIKQLGKKYTNLPEQKQAKV